MARAVIVKEKEGRRILRCLVWAISGGITDTETPRGERDSGEDHALSVGHIELGAPKGHPRGGLSLYAWAPVTQVSSLFYQVLDFLARGLGIRLSLPRAPLPAQ